MADWTRENLTQFVELERAQIGHDLHDDVIPLLFVARASAEQLASENLSCVDQKRHAAALRQIAAWLDDAMQHGRRLLGSIQSPDFVAVNWTDSVSDLVANLSGDAVEIVWRVDQELLRLPSEFAIAAHRITVEAIRNAVRHGKANRITVDVKRVGSGGDDNRSVHITIVDNGGGFDSQEVGSDHFGLRIMRSRAQLVGGELAVHSQLSQPTTVVFTFPFSG